MPEDEDTPAPSSQCIRELGVSHIFKGLTDPCREHTIIE